ncbi:MAG: FG-GAP-like repeat-containing protein [Gemmataceae bacterium]|nr:FG-GAP-like repeat-containing protein [Gemmataceae bacterium]
MSSQDRLSRRARLAAEPLEDRSTPATFTVTTAADAGAGSLRQAILDANTSAGPDNVVFAVGTGPVTVTLASPLPAMTGPTLILGNTQPGLTDPSNINPDPFFNAPFPLVTVDGTDAGAGADGLVFTGAGSSGSQVQYLQVLNFDGDGIVLDGSANGLLAFFVSSGNGGNGVLITGAGATGNRLENGFIGTDKTGNVVLPNEGDGVLITDDASGNVVGGGNFFQARCIISGNLGSGVHITGGAFGNLEQGNVIGLNAGNDADLGNGLDGVLVEGTGAGNIIGGPVGLGGIKAGNGRHGVNIQGESPGTVVFNAFAGTSAFSNRDFGNGVDGIHVEASGAGIIITTNIGSGNGRYGMYIGGDANGVVVNAALLGVGFPTADDVAIPNGVAGAVVTDNAANTQFGTTAVPAAIAALFPTVADTPAVQLQNIVAGNAGPGLIIEGNAANTRVINTNFGGGVGDVPFPDAGPSIIVRGNATGTVIGTTDPVGTNRLTFDPAGIRVETDNPVTLVRNEIFDLTGPAIGFAAGDQTQPAPVLIAARPTSSGALATGSVTGPANAALTVEFFASATAGADGTGEGQQFITARIVTTDATGLARFSVPLNVPADRPFVTATATNAAGATSGYSDVKELSPPPVIVTGPGSGGGPVVRVFAADGGTLVRTILAYEPTFRGEIRVAAGDVTGDGVADVVTAAGPGGGPRVRVFDGATGLPLAGPLGSFFAYAASFTGGVWVGSGDVNGDGLADVVVGADAGGGPNVKVFSGADGSQLASFFAFEPTFTGGVRVAAGDVNGDGRDDIVAAAGPGGSPRVVAFSGANPGEVLADFFAFAAGYTGGVFVGAGDLTGTGVESIVAGTGAGGSDVRWFAANGTQQGQVTAFPGFAGGVTVAAADATGDGVEDVVAGAGPGGGPAVAAFDALTEGLVESFFAYEPAFAGGVFVGGA